MWLCVMQCGAVCAVVAIRDCVFRLELTFSQCSVQMLTCSLAAVHYHSYAMGEFVGYEDHE